MCVVRCLDQHYAVTAEMVVLQPPTGSVQSFCAHANGLHQWHEPGLIR